ncbi:IclR family transcriptional regulator [Granulicoccus phenolivorans]|uniref:IclR family transcriptional regulator n=1 Tax=Granulicoccus phenolivorans TaxID=266854 RepID=UPI00041B9172|nr:IclR family transcriptional regulator C-terminal domain-containing protein [Granulicoccus phenolivorans]
MADAPTKRSTGRNGGATKGLPVPAAARAMAVFEIFSREKRELTKSEVARLLDMPESSSSDLLDTLYQIGYLMRTPSTRRYYPTSRLQYLADEVTGTGSLQAFAAEAAALLAERSEETCAAAILEGDRIKTLAVGEGRHRLRYVLNAGDTFTIHATALGKALLSALPADERGHLLRLKPLTRRTPHTTTDPSTLEAEIEESVARGWFAANNEGTMGVSSLAVAGVVGGQSIALGMIGPSERVLPAHDELLGKLIEVRRAVFPN